MKSIGSGAEDLHQRYKIRPVVILPKEEPRLWKYVQKGDGCWLWTGATNKRGYGIIHLKAGVFLAHRVVFTLVNGPVSSELVMDHLCRVHGCCNPAHLQAVTQTENILVGFSPSALNKRKTHCKRGHEFTPENTGVTRSGNRYCRACRQLWRESAAERARNKEVTAQ